MYRTQQQGTPTPPPTPSPTATPTPTYPHFGDGTYQVGKDIKPGTYRTRVGSSNCYYARLKGFGGTLDDIIANNNTDAPAVVTIAATDKGLNQRTVVPGRRICRKSRRVKPLLMMACSSSVPTSRQGHTRTVEAATVITLVCEGLGTRLMTLLQTMTSIPQRL